MSKIDLRQGDCLELMKSIPDGSIDAIITDPPYGYSFMGKDWDKAVPSVDIWQECLRVLKPGGWCMVMSAPRSDVQNAMISRLMEAGFRLDFTPIYWTYASGFPKAGNVGKLVDKRKGTTPDQSREFAEYIKARRLELGITLSLADKTVCNGTTNYSWFEGRPRGQRLPRPSEYELMKSLLKLDNRFDEFIGEAEREVVGKYKSDAGGLGGIRHGQKGGDITISSTPQAKALDGSYTGFQPKPAVEVIIVAMKPLSEKTYVDQALKNGKGITWLDDCRVPTGEKLSGGSGRVGGFAGKEDEGNKGLSDYRVQGNEAGRFPANLLVSDDVLNDGTTKTKAGKPYSYAGKTYEVEGFIHDSKPQAPSNFNDSGSYSRYFDLDKWAAAHLTEQQMQTFPFAIFPKASKSEKNKGVEHLEGNMHKTGARTYDDICANCKKKLFGDKPFRCECEVKVTEKRITKGNFHPTVKPIKLMSYLITLTTREGDTVLDPFMGSGSTGVACKNLNRDFIGIELDETYFNIAKERIATNDQL